MSYVAHPIPVQDAREFIKAYHYSGKSVNNSKINLGLFKDGSLVGVLQYGPPMNGKKTAAKLSDEVNMMELNRMAMHPDEPRNSESQAIAACNKWLRKNTDVKWLLSFSDGKQGNVGYIYQATNWTYLGYALSDSFYELDGDIFHSVTVWHRYKEKHPLRDTHTTHEILGTCFKNVSRITSKQHVYVLALDKRPKFEFKFPSKPYPKKDQEIAILRRSWYYRDGVACSDVEVYDESPMEPIL